MTVVTKEEGLIYSDISGIYPIKSTRGNQYTLVYYNYDRNAILTEALPSRSGPCINKGVHKLLDKLKTSGPKPNIQIMDNEACDLLKNTLPRKIYLTSLFALFTSKKLVIVVIISQGENSDYLG